MPEEDRVLNLAASLLETLQEQEPQFGYVIDANEGADQLRISVAWPQGSTQVVVGTRTLAHPELGRHVVRLIIEHAAHALQGNRRRPSIEDH